jgi:TPR repeat protein
MGITKRLLAILFTWILLDGCSFDRAVHRTSNEARQEKDVNSKYHLALKLFQRTRDYSKAIDRLIPLCTENGHIRSCGSLGQFLKEVEKIELARKYLEKACDLKHKGSCYLLGEIQIERKNMFKAKEYFKLSCSGENPSLEGCHNLAIANFDDDYRDRAYSIFKKNCKSGHQNSCYSYDVLGSNRANTSKATLYLIQACEKNDALSCFNLGSLLSKFNNPKLKKYFYSKSCELGYEAACRKF